MTPTLCLLIESGGGSEIALLGVLALTVIAGAVLWVAFHRRPKGDRERERRLGVNHFGRMADAVITEITEQTVYYSYEVRGVSYATSQEIGQFRDLLPTDPTVLIGPAWLKYTPDNPANSIVICEAWSGLREAGRPSSSNDQIQKGA